MAPSCQNPLPCNPNSLVVLGFFKPPKRLPSDKSADIRFYLSSSRKTFPYSRSRTRNGWFLVPTFAPFLGTVIGVIIYQLMVGFHVEGEARDRSARLEEENLRLTGVSANDSAKNNKEVL